MGVSRCFAVRHPPEGPPVWAALNSLPSLIPPPNFHQPDPVYFSRKGEYFRAFGLLCPDGSKPFGAFVEDDGYVGVSLDIVYVGRHAEIAGFGREGGLHCRFAAEAFHRVDEGGFFSADEGPCAIADGDIEGETCSEDVFAQEPEIFCLGDGDLQARM
jgi:hypothetical protein